MQLPSYFQSKTKDVLKTLIHEKSTPFLVLDLSVVEHQYQELKNGFKPADVYYAVKANPADEIIERLVQLGSSFDLASANELKKVLKFNVEPSRLSFGNTIKKRADIQYFYEQGVRLFVTDSEADLRNIAQYAPHSKVFFRLAVDGSETADWPLTKKFGCSAASVIELAILAKELGLMPYGVSFHVGSQQRNIATWEHALIETKTIFDTLKNEHQITFKMLNLGGGLPAKYVQETEKFATYAMQINKALMLFSDYTLDQIIIEPGRSLVANSGVLVSETILVSSREDQRWVYTDVGVFNGLIETIGECTQYPILSEKVGKKAPAILAGPTCDSMDIMYQHQPYHLPEDLDTGDHLYWLSTGAYTTSYSSIEFNGFLPLSYHVVD